MFENTPFAFDPEKMAEFFKSNDFTKMMSDLKMPEFDTDALLGAQQKNMEALAAANRAAAAGYQDLFRKQVAIFEETMAEARRQMKDIELPKVDARQATAQAELAKTAFEKALTNMQALAEAAHAANAEAFEIVSARVRESIGELKAMADKAKG